MIKLIIMKEIKKTLFTNKIIKSCYEVNKSKFITKLTKVNSLNEVNNFLIENNEKTAKHNIYAYRIVEDGHEFQKFENDGEPRGTSGDVILKYLIQRNIYNVCVLVIRYFGGTKLGSGKLTRSYLNGIVDFEKQSNLWKDDLWKIYEFSFNINVADKVNNILKSDDSFFLIKKEFRNLKLNIVFETNKKSLIDKLSVLL